jgi:hypothetical protein
MALTNRGDFEGAARVGDELLAFAEQSGNSVATVVGNVLLAHLHLTATDHEAAIEAAEAACAQAGQPHVRSLALSFLALGHVVAQQFAKALAAADEVLADTAPRGAVAIAVPAKVAAALASMGEGRLSKGMAALVEAHGEAVRRGALHDRRWIEFSMALLYSRIARRDVPLALGSLLRNLGFVLRHALPARRKARALLESCVRECERSEIKCHHGLAHLELATLLVRSDPRTAAGHLERALSILEHQGAQRALQRARQFAVSLGASGTTG